MEAILAFLIIVLMCYVFKLALKRGKLESVTVGIFLLIFLYGFAPVILIKFYSKRAIGITKGIETIASKPRRHVVNYEYTINGKVYGRSSALPVGIDSLVAYEGKYYVVYFPLLPSAGIMDFKQPVESIINHSGDPGY